MAKNYISLILAVIAISVSVVGCANRQAQESQKVTMSKVDTRAMGKAWDDHSIDRRPAVEDRNFVSEAVEKKIQETFSTV